MCTYVCIDERKSIGDTESDVHQIAITPQFVSLTLEDFTAERTRTIDKPGVVVLILGIWMFVEFSLIDFFLPRLIEKSAPVFQILTIVGQCQGRDPAQGPVNDRYLQILLVVELSPTG